MGKINLYGDLVVTTGSKLLSSDSDASQTTGNIDVDDLDVYFLSRRVTPPSTASSTGTAGDYAVAAGYFYQCVATNTWQRVATATW